MIQGPIRQFPFRDGAGLFLVRLGVEGMTLDYYDGWQPVEDLALQAEFRNQGLSVRLIGGRLSLKAYSAAYTLYFRPGSLPVIAPGVVELQGMVAPRYLCAYGFTGYMERLLALAGVIGAKISHTCVHDGAPACRWFVT